MVPTDLTPSFAAYIVNNNSIKNENRYNQQQQQQQRNVTFCRGMAWLDRINRWWKPSSPLDDILFWWEATNNVGTWLETDEKSVEVNHTRKHEMMKYGKAEPFASIAALLERMDGHWVLRRLVNA